MKIMHMVLNLEIGGLENLVCEMARIQTQQGDEVVVCSLDSQEASLRKVEEDGFRIIYLDRRGGKDFRLLFRLVRLLKKEKPDILHTHNKAPLIYGALVRYLTKVPVLVNTRHGELKSYRHSFLLKAHDFIITVSHAVKRGFLETSRIQENKVKVIHDGIDIKKYDGSGAVSQSLEKNGRLIIGLVARLDHCKDVFNLLNSFQKVVALVNNAELWIVGDGVLRSDLERQADILGLKDKVKFWGWRKDVAAINSAIDIFVLPSVTEGLSLALLEAMACHCPVVATYVGGIPEVVVEGKTGFLVPPKDPNAMAEAILKIASNKELAKQMGNAGRKRVEEEFSLEKMVSEYQKVYEEALSERRND